MRVQLGILALVSACLAFDAVLFSDEQALSGSHPSMEALVGGASPEHPLVFLVNPDFTLGQFSRFASVYSAEGTVSQLAQTVKDAKHSAQRFIDLTVHVPSAEVITAASEYKAGLPVYILAGEDWTSLEALAHDLLPNLAGYTAVLTATEAASQHASRVKRVSTDLLDADEGAQEQELAASPPPTGGVPTAVTTAMPLALPAYNRTDIKTSLKTECLLYLEGLNIVLTQKKGDAPASWPSAGATILEGFFDAADSNVVCPPVNASTKNGPLTYSWTLTIKSKNESVGHNQQGSQFVVPPNTVISLKLNFMADQFGYWGLSGLELLSDITVNKYEGKETKGNMLDKNVTVKANATPQGLQYMRVGAVYSYGFNCGDTPATFFESDDKQYAIGVSFHNFEVALTTVNPDKGFYFPLLVGDCVGTFSPGSLMGIVTGLILISVFIFGFLMLNSVQTMDRFDDPKQKQIVINVRE